MSGFVIERGFSERDRDAIVALMREYESGLGISLCFQGFDAEIAGLPGDYAPPGGQMLLARDAVLGALIGCVAVRPQPGAPETAEMKRLYVRPAARGLGLGRTLTLRAMAEARRLGYRRICLDTLPSMKEAQRLYRALGYRQVGVSNSEPAVLLFERELVDHDC